MASRRVRIKGIANIPQRRKPGNNGSDQVVQKEDVAKNNLDSVPNLNLTANTHVEEYLTDDNSIKTINNHIGENKTTRSDSKTHVICEEHSSNNESSEVTDQIVEIVEDEVTIPSITKPIDPDNSIITIKKISHVSNEKINLLSCNKVRDLKTSSNKNSSGVETTQRFRKPTISVNRKLKEKTDELTLEPNKESGNIILNETTISVSNTNTASLVQKVDCPETLSSTKQGPVRLSKPKDNSAKSESDTECTLVPSSPQKVINRTRIKAVPRLNKRRTSFSIGSASESEDDCRRSHSSRIRNDSLCSVASGINENQPVIEATSPSKKEYTSVIQRKCKRTEQSRKLAEARRDFYMKFNKGRPDKHKLTMLDLIFYNPATNPMSQNKKRKLSVDEEDICDTIVSNKEKSIEERADDPIPITDDEDQGVPAPQIKIGANGEIVVDEKSLVIENSETKKNREALQNSELVDGDFDAKYGIYKRVKRSKDWSKMETLRFYKALNTIGTDFTMMCELFPGRTRRELKVKFKKEERMNRSLIDRAVMKPLDFDMTELRQDVEKEGRKLEEMKKRKEEIAKAKTNTDDNVSTSSIESIKGVDSKVKEKNKKPKIKKQPPTPTKIKNDYDAVRNGINGLLDDSDDDDSHNYRPNIKRKQIQSKENNVKLRKSTRKPKINTTKTNEKVNPTENKQNDANLEPGSIVITTSKGTSGELTYKVFMVTDEQNKQEINLEPDILQNLTRGKKVTHNDINAQNILTISAHKQTSGNNEANTNSQDKSYAIDGIPIVQENTSSCDVTVAENIIFPFEECLKPNPSSRNITISHEENKMVIAMENK